MKLHGNGVTMIELLISVAMIAILAAVAIPNFLQAQVRSGVSGVRSDLAAISRALEAYYLDDIAYPAVDSSDPAANSNFAGYGVNNFASQRGYLRNMPTFRGKANAFDNLHTLTTPIAYLISYPSDVYADTPGATYNYSTPSVTLPGYIRLGGYLLWSYGPDGDQEIPTQEVGDIMPGINQGGDIIVGGDGRVETFFYAPNLFRVPSLHLYTVTYDPTNGTESTGDVWIARQ